MTLTILGWIYLFAFLLGLGYTVVGMFLSHGHGGPGHGHVGDVPTDATGVHEDLARAVAHSHHPIHGNHGAHSAEDSGQPDFPLFSPLTLALSVTIFGGVGTILNVFKMPAYMSLPLSGIAGIVGWLGAFYFFFKFFRFTQSSSEAVVDQLIGKEANVTLSIPAKGLGEITYVARGSRYNAPARSESGQPLPAGTSVTITKIEDTVCMVKESIEERLNRLDEGKEAV